MRLIETVTKSSIGASTSIELPPGETPIEVFSSNWSGGQSVTLEVSLNNSNWAAAKENGDAVIFTENDVKIVTGPAWYRINVTTYTSQVNFVAGSI